MPRTLEEIFRNNPSVEIIEFLGYDDGNPFGLSSDGRKLRIYDDNFARQLAELSGVSTESGHTNDEGYWIRGGFIGKESSYKVNVHRTPPKK